jgi:two-component system chemotaxis sensor kinase CheA
MADRPERDEVVEEFLLETVEALDRLDRELLVLEKNPHDAAVLKSAFRGLHTIKGSCGFLGLPRMEDLAHAGESLLAKLCDGELVATVAVVEGLLAVADMLRLVLASVEATGNEGLTDVGELVARLATLQDGAPDATLAEQALAEDPMLEEPPPEEPRAEEVTSEEPAPVAARGAERPALSDNSVRVSVARLDRLMNLVGELVLARNRLLQVTGALDDPAVAGATHQLDGITTELRGEVMKTRMQPVATLWEKLPRIVRDVAATCGKRVRLETEGSETEIDKTIIDAIRDPLTHLVRNGIDHGIETPEVRRAAGKSEEGCLILRAFQQGGQVHLEVSDDGKGIDVEAIRRRAIERGLATAEELERATDREIYGFIFVPGFSTAQKLTHLSGRGVGMDVVKINVERIGGRVEIETRPSGGTTIRLNLPLTLAIVPALVVSSGGDCYALPQSCLIELVRLTDMQARICIESLQGAPVLRLRGRLLPLFELARVLGNEPLPARRRRINVVVLQAAGHRFGVTVDEINDNEEIVAKPLAPGLRASGVFSGATIRGDGRVALILDVLGLARRGGLADSVGRRPSSWSAPQPDDEERGRRNPLLLLQTGTGRRVALPLSTVMRLEVFEGSAVERLDNYAAVQYRGRVLPLVDMDQLLAGTGSGVPGRGTFPVVVYDDGRRRVGLAVRRIVDVIDQVQASEPDVLNSAVATAVIQQKVTELVDLEQLLPNHPGLPVALARSS